MCGVLIGTMEGSIKNLKPVYRRWIFLVFLYIIWMLFRGLGSYDFSKSLHYLGTDISAFLLFFGGLFAGCQRRSKKAIDSMLFIHFVIAVIVTFASLFGLKDFVRGTVVSSGTYWFFGMLYAWPLFLLTIGEQRGLKKIISGAGLSIYFMLAVLCLKRTPFGKFAVYLCLVMYSYWGRKGVPRTNRYKLIGSMVILAVLLIVFLECFGVRNLGEKYGPGGLQKRFYLVAGGAYSDSIVDALSRNYRFSYEPMAVIESCSNYDKMFGKGLGATIDVPYAISPSLKTGILHNSVMTLFLKGGIVFLFIWFSGWLIVLRKFFKNRDATLAPYYAIIIVTIMFSPVAGFIDSSLGCGLLGICTGRVMAKNAEDLYISRRG